MRSRAHVRARTHTGGRSLEPVSAINFQNNEKRTRRETKEPKNEKGKREDEGALASASWRCLLAAFAVNVRTAVATCAQPQMPERSPLPLHTYCAPDLRCRALNSKSAQRARGPNDHYHSKWPMTMMSAQHQLAALFCATRARAAFFGFHVGPHLGGDEIAVFVTARRASRKEAATGQSVDRCTPMPKFFLSSRRTRE